MTELQLSKLGIYHSGGKRYSIKGEDIYIADLRKIDVKDVVDLVFSAGYNLGTEIGRESLKEQLHELFKLKSI